MFWSATTTLGTFIAALQLLFEAVLRVLVSCVLNSSARFGLVKVISKPEKDKEKLPGDKKQNIFMQALANIGNLPTENLQSKNKVAKV